MTAPDRILLIGMMGVGKTTVGRLLAAELGWPFLDSDAEIERITGKSVPEIWKSQGEPAFRAEEARVLAEACSSEGPCVVSVAGGAVLDPGNRALISSAGLVVWLRAGVPVLASRVGTGEGRPLLNKDPQAALERLYAQREPLYASLAQVVMDVGVVLPRDAVAQIVKALDEWQSGS